MSENQENIKSKSLEFPQNVEDISKEECAKILRKALSVSKKFKTQTDISRATNINEKSIGDYFTARNKPSQERWLLLRDVFFDEIIKNQKEEKSNQKQVSVAIHSLERLKSILILLKDELEYFKNSSPEIRKILKDQIPGNEVGYLASLLAALYDENQLAIFKNFTIKKELYGD
jgi:hypothetical protein